MSTPPSGAKQASMSLIDEDDDDDDDEKKFFSAASVTAVMEPMKPVLVGAAAGSSANGQAMIGEVEDDDGEWGW